MEDEVKWVRRGPSPWLPQAPRRFHDLDHDGIPDELEEELLRRFRPYYKFSETQGDFEGLPVILREAFLPTDAILQIKHAQLRDGDWTDYSPTPDIVKSCGNPPNYHLDPPEQILTCVAGKTNLMVAHNRSNFCLNIDDTYRRGSNWPDVMEHAPGLYGHVVPDVSSGGIYKIEYWQYFAYNDVDSPGFDHEGDWCTVQLWYDQSQKRIVKTAHLHMAIQH